MTAARRQGTVPARWYINATTRPCSRLRSQFQIMHTSLRFWYQAMPVMGQLTARFGLTRVHATSAPWQARLNPTEGGNGRQARCALQWRDVDLAARAITITTAVVEGPDGVVEEKDTKTHQSRRIAIDDTTAAALEEQLGRATARAQACGLEEVSENAAVFS
jgi:hypothetical protein